MRGLAATLKVTKPVITRALDTLGEMALVDRVRDPLDRRSVIVKRTVGGALSSKNLAIASSPGAARSADGDCS